MFNEKWRSDNIPDLQGRTAVITGANSGIGYHTARELAARGARVILAVRDKDRGRAAKQAILEQTPKAKIRVEVLDLTSLASIGKFAERINKSLTKLDLLINNAGIMMVPLGRTADGFERQFGTNHLGHFALTAQLFDLVVSTLDSRIVTVSSLAHRRGSPDLTDLNWETRRYSKTQAYADSKLANLLFTYELARRLESADYMTMATAAHPGYTITNLQQHTVFRYLNPLLGQKSERGALPTLRAATDPDAENGDYYGPDGIAEMGGYPKKVAASERARDRELAADLWDLSEEMTGTEFPVP